MELKPDYHETEAGLIPSDWSCRSMGECLSRPPQYGINAAAVPHTVGLPNYLRITDISEDGKFAPSPKVSVDSGRSGEYYLERGDVVFARTGASVGKSYLYKPEDGRLVYAGFLIRVRPDRNTLDPVFLANYVRANQYWNWVKTVSARSGQPGINGNEYARLPVALPPISEQRAIAEALSDVDTLIAALDALIAKKRAVKTAAMQQLLTGRQRLPGFTEVWTTTRMGALGATYGGITGKSKKDFGCGAARYIPFMNVMGNVTIAPGFLERVDIKESEGQNQVSQGDLLFNTSSETPGELAMCAAVTGDLDGVYLNSFCFGFRSTGRSWSPLYLAYYFRGSPGRNLMYSMAQGATRYNVSKRSFLGLEIDLPNFDEQKAIAAVLSDMDAEIAALEARRDKTRHIKTGMMQELLTGRTRLIPQPAE